MIKCIELMRLTALPLIMGLLEALITFDKQYSLITSVVFVLQLCN